MPPPTRLQRRGRDHSLRRAADPVEQVDAGLGSGGGDRRRDVAVADQVDARAGLAELADQLLVPVALEHDDTNVRRAYALRLRDSIDVFGRRRVDVDRLDRIGAGCDLLHVDRRAREEHRAALRDRDHGDRIGLAERCQPRPLERIDGDVDRRTAAVADLLPVVEHRRLVLLPLADHDHAFHRDGVEHRPHRVDGGLVGGDLVAAPDPAAGAHGSGLGDADQLESKVAVGTGGRHPPPS